MSAPCPTPSCRYDRPGHRMLCGGCEADLARALGDVPWLAGQLDVVLSKQGSHAPAGRRTGVPLPYDPRATEAGFVLKSALVGWVRILVEVHPEDGPADTLPAIAVWLLARVERLAMHHAAGEAVDEICSAVRSAVRLVDRPADSVFAGRCPECAAALYARPDAPRVSCRECATSVDVAEQRESMLARVEDQLAHSAAMGALLRQLGVKVADSTIRYFAQKGRIISHGKDRNGRPLYRLGEVLDVAIERKARAG